MGTGGWHQAKELLADALVLPAEERDAFLLRECDDPQLRDRVRQLLDVEAGGGLLDALLTSSKLDDLPDLEPGTHVGPYVIVERLGAGGMGAVFLGTDTRLRRKVALKCLLSHAAESDLKARILREARAAASITHPNVAAVYDVVEEDGRAFIVMEYVDGESLAARLQRGKIAPDVALAIGRQLAAALGAAHAHGVVHRDLKPANIQLTPDGTVKVLDFGIARSASSTASTLLSTAVGSAARGVAQPGTPPYMAPEQLAGDSVDERSDIYAWGLVVYEILVGHRPHAEIDPAALLAASGTPVPAPQDIDPAISQGLGDVVARAINPSPDKRFQTAAALIAALDAVPSGTAPTRGQPFRSRQRVAIAIAGLTVVAALTAAVVVLIPSLRSSSSAGVVSTARVVVALPAGLTIATPGDVAISRDGRTIAFVGNASDRVGLYIRHLEEPAPRLVADAPYAAAPFFSADGAWIAFFDIRSHAVKKVPTAGGPVQIVCKGCTERPLGGCWTRDDHIIFAAWPKAGIWEVSASGRTPPRSVVRSTPNAPLMWPTLVDDRTLLYTLVTGGQGTIMAVALDSPMPRTILASASRPRFLAPGHIAFTSEGRLHVVGFDATKLSITGDPWVGVDGLVNDVRAASYDISATGTLAYVSGTASLDRVVWRDRSGAVTPVTQHAARYSFPAIAPDGKRFAVSINEGFARNVWVGRFGEEALTRLTRGDDDMFPLWMQDGSRIVFTSGRDHSYNLFIVSADGGEPTRLTDAPASQRATSLSRSGDVILFNDNTAAETGLDVWQMRLVPPAGPQPYLRTPHNESEATFSPDGRWVAYRSDETGAGEVYVQAYRGPGKRQISVDGGSAPTWNPNGHELFYTSLDALYAVSISPRGEFLEYGPPVRLFSHASNRQIPSTNYSVSPDGQKFLMIESGSDALSAGHLNVVLNWRDEFRGR